VRDRFGALGRSIKFGDKSAHGQEGGLGELTSTPKPFRPMIEALVL
jgi:hypothetical protein